MEDRESRRYYFPETLNNQKRWFGLPPEEAVILIGCGGLGFWIDMFVIMLITGGALWLLVRHLKKGQGSWWLLNLLYWYLPTTLFRTQLRRVPDSGNRHWMQ